MMSSNKISKGKKTRKVGDIKKLHSVLKSLLKDKNSGKSTTDNAQEVLKDDVIYIKSKENHLIPKLTDEEVLLKHKRADEAMKNSWLNIISKYENLDNQTSDIIDLNTGEIIEDNGHLRSLSNPTTDDSAKKKNNVWEDNEPELDEIDSEDSQEGVSEGQEPDDDDPELTNIYDKYITKQ